MAEKVGPAATRKIRLMEVCGTHTMVIARMGLKKLLPPSVELVSGPGCPVCVTPEHEIDRALAVAEKPGVIMATFGDMMRVPGSRKSLADIKASGGDVRVVYSCLDALEIASENPGREVVFMGVGFETTAPTVAATVLEARRKRTGNFFILCNFKTVFPALSHIGSSKKLRVDGFICPGHVSVITGSRPYEAFASLYKKACVITGFGDADVLKGVKRLIEKVKESDFKVETEYGRAVTRQGNKTARQIMNRVFRTADARWRGLGTIPESGLALKKEFARFDAGRRFRVRVPAGKTVKGCLCGEVLQGYKSPGDCRLFGRACVPSRPVGPCMVSSEGTCAAYYKYGV
ncbi:MAG: hydrogenase formation protein HypD [Candidatus Omnitrophota bacterium]